MREAENKWVKRLADKVTLIMLVAERNMFLATGYPD